MYFFYRQRTSYFIYFLIKVRKLATKLQSVLWKSKEIEPEDSIKIPLLDIACIAFDKNQFIASAYLIRKLYDNPESSPN